MSCPAHTDMDIAVQLRKVNRNGTPLEHANYTMPAPLPSIPNSNVAKHLGPSGLLRASHAASLLPKSHPDAYPAYSHRRREAVAEGSVVGLEIPIWPVGMVFEKGEGMLLRVAGRELGLPEVLVPHAPPPRWGANEGVHVVHTGGEYGSFLMLPVIT